MSAAADTADLSPQSPSGRLLSLVRKLWDYGLQISDSLRQHPPKTPNAKAHLKRTFGISNVMAILVRIALGMKRARFLSERITSTAAQIDAGSQPEPAPPRASRASATPRKPRPYPEPRPTDETLALVRRLRTLAHIDRTVLREPIGVVLADICRDFGISADHPLWDELQAAITEFGGTLVARARTRLQQVFPPPGATPPLNTEPESKPEPASTGPPLPVAA